jgi:hypothetical protein
MFNSHLLLTVAALLMVGLVGLLNLILEFAPCKFFNEILNFIFWEYGRI